MSDENVVDADAWRQEQLRKAEENPEEALAAIRQVLGDELFEKTFQKKEPEPKPEPKHEPVLDADGVTVLDAIERMNRVPSVVDKAIDSLGDLPFKDTVRQHVHEELSKIPASEKVQLSDEDIIGYTRLAAGYIALHQMMGEKPQEQPKPAEESEKKEEPPRVPDDMRGPRSQIMEMKPALLSHGFSEAEIEAMCND